MPEKCCCFYKTMIFYWQESPVSPLHPFSHSHLRDDFDFRTVVHRIPDFFDFFVTNRDTTSGPIAQIMERTQAPDPVGQTVNHNFAAGREAALGSARFISFIRVINVERQMKFALRITPIKPVAAFRCASIAFRLLVARDIGAKSNAISFQCLSLIQERQPALPFFH